jgi:threonylcarbamoyladenosine tRNA methylthiotransferase MtaB
VVTEKDKKLRSKRLLDLSDEKTIAFYQQHVGQEAEVLFEKATRGRAMHGFTRNYIRVELSPKDADPALDNQLVKVKLGELTADKQSLRAYII